MPSTTPPTTTPPTTTPPTTTPPTTTPPTAQTESHRALSASRPRGSSGPGGPGAIDLLTPAQVCRRLGVDEVELLALVNGGRLAAFDLAGNVRFRPLDVVAALTSRQAAGAAA